MNENPDRGNWQGAPQERMPVPAQREVRELWQPPPGYVQDDSGYGPQESGSFVHDLQRYFWILFRHRWIVLGTAFLFVCVGLVVTLLTTPIYQASATIQIDREPAKIVNVETVQADVGSDAAFYATQYEILKSRSLAEQIVQGFSVEELLQFTQQKALAPWKNLWNKIVGLMRPQADASAEESDSPPPVPDDVDVPGLQKAAAYKLLGGSFRSARRARRTLSG